MNPLKSNINLNSNQFQQNKAEMEKLIQKLEKHLQDSRFEGKEKHIDKARSRNKMLARERIELVLDQDSPFLELLPLVGKSFIDEHKNLNIIGRVKDAFKTEKGIYITPNPIENSLSKNELIEQVCVAGLTSPQPIALINLSEIAEGSNNKQIAENLTEQLKNTNQKLSNHSKVECIVITNESWSEENHILTPTLKVKRNKIDEKYMNKYKDWYNQKESIIWE